MARIRSGGARLGLLGCAALVATSLTACGGDVRDEDVRLADVRDAVVVSGSSSRPAADGDTLRKGDHVRTGESGTATLVVRDRRVVLGGGTDIGVPDGATVDLARGAVLVDRRRGPGLTVRAGDTTLDRIGEGALRVERSLSVLVAGLSAGGRVRTATGQRLEFAPLYQVGVAGRALPRGGVPLLLRRDAWEREVIRGIVEDDVVLSAQAAELDGPNAAIPVAYKPDAGVPASVKLLSEAIGRAAGGAAAAQRATAERARELRAQGGSWGVVAALSRTSAVDVAAALAQVLDGVPATTAPETPGASVTPGPVAGRSPQPVPPGSTPQPSRTAPTGGGATPTPSRPTGTRSQTPSPSPTSITDEIGKIIPTPLAPVPSLAGSLLGS